MIKAVHTLIYPVADIDAAVDQLVAAGVTMDRYPDFEQDDKGIARGPEGPAVAWSADRAPVRPTALGRHTEERHAVPDHHPAR